MSKNRWEYFTLQYDPEPSGQYKHGSWYCYAEPGYDGSGLTPIDAMAACLAALSKAFVESREAK